MSLDRLADKKGSVLRALPFAFLMLLSAAVHSAGFPQLGQNAGNADSGAGFEVPWSLLSLNPDVLAEPNRSLGFPGPSGGSLSMLGGGLAARKAELRWAGLGMTGGLSAKDGDKASNWNLDLVALFAEQRYEASSFEITAGFAALYGVFGAELRDNMGFTRFESRFFGTGTLAGLRWPAKSKMSFFTRGGYLWLPASGAWNGTLRDKMSKTYYDLSAPFSQAGLDLIF